MAFLDNTGDIILDAVLTEVGRRKLAQGNGSFKISRFYLGDDEIDYSLYNANDPSGSAYAGKDILLTPVLQASTDAKVGVKHALFSVANYNPLYLPGLELLTSGRLGQPLNTDSGYTNTYVLLATQTAVDAFSTFPTDGVLNGVSIAESAKSEFTIRLDQGIAQPNADNLTWQDKLPDELNNTSFAITVDHRLLRILEPDGSEAPFSQANTNGENLATYIVTKRTTPKHFPGVPNAANSDSDLAGARGDRLALNLKVAPQVQASQGARSNIGFTTLSSAFSVLGASTNPTSDVGQIKVTEVTVQGLQTGARLSFRVTVLAHNGD